MNVPGGGVMTYGQLPNVWPWPGCPVTPGQGQHPTLHLGQEEEQSIDIIHTHYTHALAAQHLQWHCAVSGGNWVWAGNQFHLTTVIKCPEDGNELMSC